jgi:hypothetical protein
MPAIWTHKLPNCYFVGPDGRTHTVPAVDGGLLHSSLVRELLGLRPRVEAAREDAVRIEHVAPADRLRA